MGRLKPSVSVRAPARPDPDRPAGSPPPGPRPAAPPAWALLLVRLALALAACALFAGVAWPLLYREMGLDPADKFFLIGQILAFVAGYMAAVFQFHFPQND